MQAWMKVIVFGFAARCSVSLLRQISGRTGRKLLSTQKSSSASLSREGSTPVADLRKEYSRQGLEDSDPNLQAGPFALFTSWLNDACAAKVMEPNAMCLSTCVNNVPSARFVLLKGYDRRGFVWYTNYNSRKSWELEQNPNACITFWWGDLERSVRIEGKVEKVSAEESDSYFQSRPRGSQLGAWTSNQSSDIPSRFDLEEQEKKIIAELGDKATIPRPPHWGGFRLVPKRIEFWKGRESRLHDRLVFEREDAAQDVWKLKRLQP